MHLATIDVLALQCSGHLFHLHFAAAEDDDALQIVIFEQLVDDANLLSFMAHVGALMNFFSRFAHG